MELLSGADMVVRSLADEGVEYIYGYSGGALLHVYDAIFSGRRLLHTSWYVMNRRQPIWRMVMQGQPVNQV